MKKKEKIPAKEPEENQTEPEMAQASSAPESEEKSEETAEEKLKADISEFHTLFPDVKADQIPREVWDRVDQGESLTASYAVFFVRALREEERIAKVNAENEKTAPPRVRHDGTDGDYFSPDAVRAMSRDEVKKHYQEILRSMDHWN